MVKAPSTTDWQPRVINYWPMDINYVLPVPCLTTDDWVNIYGEGTIVGIRFPDPSDVRASDDTSRSSLIMEGLDEASQTKYNATVVGDVQIAEILCDTLVEAEGASSLTFTFSPGETIVADKTFYNEHSGDVFTDGLSRKVWAGTEEGTDPLQARRVTMTWAEECSAETFLLKLDTNNGDGTFTVVKTIPCTVGTDTNICVLEVEVNVEDIPPPGELTPLTQTNQKSDGRRLQGEIRRRKNLKNTITRSKHLQRQLQTTEQVDVLLFYTPEAMQEQFFTSTAQMESYIADAMAGVQIGVDTSWIDLNVNPVHIQMLPYIETATIATEIRSNLTANAEVATMRDFYGADLVHLITGVNLIGSEGGLICGSADLLEDSHIEDGTADQNAFGVTAAGDCVMTHTLGHELGHNFGCWHDIATLLGDDDDEDSVQVNYYHGFRNCLGSVPFGTIMAYSCPDVSDYQHLNVYSTPYRTYNGIPVGSVDTENCARRIQETMSILAGYRTRSAPTPSPMTPAPMIPVPTFIPGPTPEPTPTPQPAAPTETLVEAAERTTVTVYANGFDERTSGSGCSPSGCVAANTRDGAPSTRWSCKKDLTDGKNCKITFEFDDAQDIVLMRVAFYKGDERTRKLKVIVNNSNLMTIESSGTTDEFEMFTLNTDETKDLTLEALGLAGGEWISLEEVEFMVI